MGQICIIFDANLVSLCKINYAGTAPSKDAIRDEFSEELYQYQSIKKASYLIPLYNFIGTNKMQI